MLKPSDIKLEVYTPIDIHKIGTRIEQGQLAEKSAGEGYYVCKHIVFNEVTGMPWLVFTDNTRIGVSLELLLNKNEEEDVSLFYKNKIVDMSFLKLVRDSRYSKT